MYRNGLQKEWLSQVGGICHEKIGALNLDYITAEYDWQKHRTC
jgi:hypothetical protein